jgi:hypothetical protein
VLHFRESAVGASRYEHDMKYTLELQTEKFKLGCAGSFRRYSGREYVCTHKQVDCIYLQSIRVVPRAFRPFQDEGSFCCIK